MLGQENLDSLMIINVERDITVSVSKIIQTLYGIHVLSSSLISISQACTLLIRETFSSYLELNN